MECPLCRDAGHPCDILQKLYPEDVESKAKERAINAAVGTMWSHWRNIHPELVTSEARKALCQKSKSLSLSLYYYCYYVHECYYCYYLQCAPTLQVRQRDVAASVALLFREDHVRYELRSRSPDDPNRSTSTSTSQTRY